MASLFICPALLCGCYRQISSWQCSRLRPIETCYSRPRRCKVRLNVIVGKLQMQIVRFDGGNRLRKVLLLANVWILGAALLAPQEPTAVGQTRWKAEAARVTIVRDDWGIAHVHGESDADAVFGMIYAQCEDDFNRVETNYLTSLGRTAETEGESAIWQDLRQQLFLDQAELKRDYAASPEWLKLLMNAWAGGINFYLPAQ